MVNREVVHVDGAANKFQCAISYIVDSLVNYDATPYVLDVHFVLCTHGGANAETKQSHYLKIN